ncbi:hypothetical protein DL771_009503 [Monosporascus sp. 5C6A]|nr:hypothetical protein DL771_009503 [Monosporascus sp. 5C6A]
MAGKKKAADIREVATSEPPTIRHEESEGEYEDEIHVNPDTQSASDTADRDIQIEDLKEQIAEVAVRPALLPSVEVLQSTLSSTGQRKGGDVVALRDGTDPTVTNWIMLIRDKFQDEPYNYPDEPSQIRYGRRRLEGTALSRVGAYLQRGKDFDSLESFFKFLRNNVGNKSPSFGSIARSSLGSQPSSTDFAHS